ncbi:MAG: zinc-binding alcohol dehydrogenase family protein [Cyclobacteriaceae bacterium]|nr:zinc-binding alcohol dehydrogenase family protein [Cyclobacteriaceae bacterium]
MKYISCENPNQLALGNKDKPVHTAASALLKVNRVGICGTDLHAFKGNQPYFVYPRVLGHELATTVIDIDDTASGIKKGDQVVIIPYMNCEECAACTAGKSNCCQRMKVMGVHTDGGMQEYITVPNRLLLRANDMTLDEIAIVEPLAIGAHALRRAQTKRGDLVVVMGCGPIGMGIIQLAKYIGATVIALDVNNERLQKARKSFGADFVLNPTESPFDQLKEFTKGELAHTVFDATGNKLAMQSGTDYMRHGGNLVLVGLFKGELAFHHPTIHAKETSLLCCRNATPEDFMFVMKVLREKKFNAEAYITKRENYTAIPTAFNTWASPESNEIKILTVWD